MAYDYAWVPSTSDGLTVMAKDEETDWDTPPHSDSCIDRMYKDAGIEIPEGGKTLPEPWVPWYTAWDEGISESELRVLDGNR